MQALLEKQKRVSGYCLQAMRRYRSLLAWRKIGMALQGMQVVNKFEKWHCDAGFESAIFDLVYSDV